MSITTSIILLLAVMIGLYIVVLYNGFVQIRNQVDKSFANIDVLLKQRHTQIPMLLEVCKGYMQHEQTTLEAVIKARNQVETARQHHNVKALGLAETNIQAGVHKLFALAEQYPNLKADNQFTQLHDSIIEIENGITNRREMFNEIVRINNTRVEQIPDKWLAILVGFELKEYLQFDAAIQNAVKLS